MKLPDDDKGLEIIIVLALLFAVVVLVTMVVVAVQLVPATQAWLENTLLNGR